MFPSAPPFGLSDLAKLIGVSPAALEFLLQLAAESVTPSADPAPSGGLTVKQVCVALGVKRSKVYSLIATGDLPAFKVGGAVRIDPAELADWKRKNRVAPVPLPSASRHFD
jgi:excisionase family DNA binding protein